MQFLFNKITKILPIDFVEKKIKIGITYSFKFTYTSCQIFIKYQKKETRHQFGVLRVTIGMAILRNVKDS